MANPATVLGLPRADRLLIGLGVPAAGLLIGLLLPPLARWLVDLRIPLPFRFVVRGLGSVDRPAEIGVNLAIWVVLGLMVVATAVREALRVTITDAELHLTGPGWARTIARADVAAVFLDGRDLVVLDQASRQLVHHRHEAPERRLAAAFDAHGYPWLAADPHAGRYRPWVPDTPDLPPTVNAVLRARQTVLRRRGDAASRDARDLLDQVQQLGFTVRDDSTGQHWRSLDPH